MKRKYFYRYRSAITGNFITKAKAERNPKTSIRERVARK